ncbi:hypothetical protein ACS0TY_015114 [Phlomoides rotata]
MEGPILVICTGDGNQETVIYQNLIRRSFSTKCDINHLPLLVIQSRADTFEDENGVSKGLIKLHLDNLDIVWMEQYKDLDYVIIAGGK